MGKTTRDQRPGRLYRHLKRSGRGLILSGGLLILGAMPADQGALESRLMPAHIALAGFLGALLLGPLSVRTVAAAGTRRTVRLLGAGLLGCLFLLVSQGMSSPQLRAVAFWGGWPCLLGGAAFLAVRAAREAESAGGMGRTGMGGMGGEEVGA